MTMPPAARMEDLRALAVRAVADSLRAAGGGADERAARFEECVRGLEAEKAKMEVFRRELPISVHLVADVIEWLKDELAQLHHRRRPGPAQPEPFAPAAKRKSTAPDAGAGVKPEAEDKRSWMSSAQLWSCGSVVDDSTGNSSGAKKPAHKQVSNAFVPLIGTPVVARRSTDDAEKPAATPPLPDLSLSSPGACPAAPSATSSAVTDAAGAQRHQNQQQAAQKKARRCWSPELHRRFVAALQRLGGAQAATPKQIRELMKVDGLTNDEVKSHLQKYRLHTRRASSDSDDKQAASAAGTGLWSGAPDQQYTTSQHSTSQSGSPQGPLQLTVSSSRAVSARFTKPLPPSQPPTSGMGGNRGYRWKPVKTVTKFKNQTGKRKNSRNGNRKR